MIDIKGRSILDLSADEMLNLVAHDPPDEESTEPEEEDAEEETVTEQ